MSDVSLLWQDVRTRVLQGTDAGGAITAIAADGNGSEFVLDQKYATLMIDVYGTLTNLRVNFEALYHTNSGAHPLSTDWEAVYGITVSTGLKTANTYVTAAGRYLIDCTGMKKFRARISDYVAGSVVVRAYAYPIPIGVVGSITIPDITGTDGGTQLTKAIAVGGNDGANFQVLSTDVNGKVHTSDTAAAGGGTPSYASLVAGAEGGNLRPLKVDTAGRQEVIGAAVTWSAPAAVNVTNASGLVLAANANRVAAKIQNISDVYIDLTIGGAAVLGAATTRLAPGSATAPGGELYISSTTGDLDVRIINGIHGAGAVNKAVMVSEAVRA